MINFSLNVLNNISGLVFVSNPLKVIQSAPVITEVETPSPISTANNQWFANEQPKISFSAVDQSWAGEDDWSVSESDDDPLYHEKSPQKGESSKSSKLSVDACGKNSIAAPPGLISSNIQRHLSGDINSRQLALVSKSTSELIEHSRPGCEIQKSRSGIGET